jgi:hypothetical protein
LFVVAYIRQRRNKERKGVPLEVLFFSKTHGTHVIYFITRQQNDTIFKAFFLILKHFHVLLKRVDTQASKIQKFFRNFVKTQIKTKLIVGDRLVKDYVVDPKTGFLTPSPALVGPGLNAAQKTLFISKFCSSFNFTKAAKQAQTDRATIQLHLSQDIAFQKAFQAAQDEILDEVEASLYSQSQRSPIAAMQLLKAKRSNDWVPNKKSEGSDKVSDKLKALIDESN